MKKYIQKIFVKETMNIVSLLHFNQIQKIANITKANEKCICTTKITLFEFHKKN